MEVINKLQTLLKAGGYKGKGRRTGTPGNYRYHYGPAGSSKGEKVGEKKEDESKSKEVKGIDPDFARFANVVTKENYDLDRVYSAIRKYTDVPPAVANKFMSKFGEGGEKSPKEATKSFIEYVRKNTTPPREFPNDKPSTKEEKIMDLKDEIKFLEKQLKTVGDSPRTPYKARLEKKENELKALQDTKESKVEKAQTVESWQLNLMKADRGIFG
jgi:hypothetical protein